MVPMLHFVIHLPNMFNVGHVSVTLRARNARRSKEYKMSLIILQFSLYRHIES